MDVGKLAAEILQDTALALDLFNKIKDNIAQAKDVLQNDPSASVSDQLAEAQAKLKTIQDHANQADADFNSALAAVNNS